MVGDVDNGGGNGERDRGDMGNLCLVLSIFALNLKLVNNMVSSLGVAGCAGERLRWQAEGWTRPTGVGEESRVPCADFEAMRKVCCSGLRPGLEHQELGGEPAGMLWADQALRGEPSAHRAGKEGHSCLSQKLT